MFDDLSSETLRETIHSIRKINAVAELETPQGLRGSFRGLTTVNVVLCDALG